INVHLKVIVNQIQLNSLVDSIKFLFSVYTENMIEVFKVPPQMRGEPQLSKPQLSSGLTE
ncbi:hypothetical protein L9F63_002184, partial [Diploptera punctata]